jgi:ketosteroid isomerase-like protein
MVRDYPVDARRLVVGGFSSGGVASLDLVLHDAIPARGFVALCPGRPPDFTPEAVRDAVARGVRGALLTTEMDGRHQDQRAMAAILEAEGMVHRFVVTPDVGHWFPDDLAESIDEALALICDEENPIMDTRTEIAQTIRDSIGWALTKDRPLLERVIAHDPRLFIFHPDSKSTIRGWEEFAKMFSFWMDPRFKATRFDVRDLRIDLSGSGTVAWFSAILDDCGEWAGKPSCWENTRWTGVLERRENQWRILQMHFSFAEDEVRAAAAKP